MSSANPDEDMTWLLAAVQTADAQVELKIDCLLTLHALLGERYVIDQTAPGEEAKGSVFFSCCCCCCFFTLELYWL